MDIDLKIELMGLASQLNVETEETEAIRNDSSVNRQMRKQPQSERQGTCP